MVSLHEQDDDHIIEDKSAEGRYSSEPEKAQPPVSLLLWCEMVAMPTLYSL